jgi:hypothetical protein
MLPAGVRGGRRVVGVLDLTVDPVLVPQQSAGVEVGDHGAHPVELAAEDGALVLVFEEE